MATTNPPDRQAPAGSAGGEESRPQKGMTIGVVCKGLAQEFPDISISKIRYLEDQKLLNPRRTAGGYRLYSPSDMVRLRTILRLQRDEFLPLRGRRWPARPRRPRHGRAGGGGGGGGGAGRAREGARGGGTSKPERRAGAWSPGAGEMGGGGGVLEEPRAPQCRSPPQRLQRRA